MERIIGIYFVSLLILCVVSAIVDGFVFQGKYHDEQIGALWLLTAIFIILMAIDLRFLS